MQVFIFLVLSVIIAYHSVLTPHISKTHLSIHLMYVNSNWNDTQKTSQGKWETPLRGSGNPTPPAKP